MEQPNKKLTDQEKINMLQELYSMEYNNSLKLEDRINKALLFFRAKIKENIEGYKDCKLFNQELIEEIVNIYTAFEIEIERQFDIILNGDDAEWFNQKITFENLLSNSFAGGL